MMTTMTTMTDSQLAVARLLHLAIPLFSGLCLGCLVVTGILCSWFICRVFRRKKEANDDGKR